MTPDEITRALMLLLYSSPRHERRLSAVASRAYAARQAWTLAADPSAADGSQMVRLVITEVWP